MSAERERWLRQRRQGIGASDMAAVLGESPWRSPFAVYASKVGEVHDEDEESPRLKAGRLLEPVVAKWFADDTGHVLENPGRHTIQRHPEIPYLLATLDRKIVGRLPSDLFPAGSEGVLEIKTTSERQSDHWGDGAPLWVQIQIQHQILVTGLSWGYAAVLIGGQRLLHFRQERNDRFLVVLKATAAEFWRRVELRDPPPPDGLESTKDAIASLYRTVTPGAVADLQAEPSLEGLDADLQRWKAAKKEAEEHTALLENRLRVAIGTSEAALLPGGVVYTWKAQSRAAYTVPANTFRVLRRKSKKED